MHNTSAHPWTKNYQPGVPAEIELPTESLAHMFARSVAQAGDSPATEFFGRQMSYAELGEQVERVAEGLRRLGVTAGERVALILPNCPQHVIAFYAVLRLAPWWWSTIRCIPPANCVTSSRTIRPGW